MATERTTATVLKEQNQLLIGHNSAYLHASVSTISLADVPYEAALRCKQ
jgi:hypothetical protein